MVKAQKYVVKTYFEGLPKREDFEIVEEELPPLNDGEILVKTEWVSVDPYLRLFNKLYEPPYDQFSHQVGLVEDSKDEQFPVGTRVVSHKGWCDYFIIDPSKTIEPADKIYKLPDLNEFPASLGVGAVGMPGATAYFGLLNICKPQAGETIVVSGAAGAVGSLVGQIAKIKGCKVIGFAGSDDKVKWLEEIGFDKAFNYKTADITASLKSAAPDGVDMYFDNVGGEISSLIINQMRKFGRISLCGCISSYNEDPAKLPKVGVLQPAMLMNQLKLEAFNVWRWADQWDEALLALSNWIKSGVLVAREHVTEGFDNIYDAFIGMLHGDNVGKAVVKI